MVFHRIRIRQIPPAFMQSFRCFVLWFLFACSPQAMETVAYRFAAAPFPDNAPGADAIMPKELRPESRFIGRNDELVDLSGWLRGRGVALTGGWAAWDRTTGTMIVRAAKFDQWHACEVSGFSKQHGNVTARVDWFFGADVWPAPKKGRRPDASLILATEEDCCNARAEITRGNGSGRHFRAMIPVVRYAPWTARWSLGLETDWSVNGGDSWGANLATSVGYDEPTPVAGWRSLRGEDTWILATTIDMALDDGTRWEKARAREAGDQEEFIPHPFAYYGPFEANLAGGWKAKVFSVSDLTAVLGEAYEYSDPEERMAFPLPKTAVPKHLSGWCLGTAIDMKPKIKEHGVPFAKEDTAILDPTRKWLLVCSRNPMIFDLVRQLCSPRSDRMTDRTFHAEVALEETGGRKPSELFRCFVAEGRGSKSSVWRTGKSGRSFHFESVCYSTLIDISYKLSAGRMPGTGLTSWKQESSTLIREGGETTGTVVHSPGGPGIRQRIKATIHRFGPK